MKLDPLSVSASPRHLSPIDGGADVPTASIAPILSPHEVGERWSAQPTGEGVSHADAIDVGATAEGHSFPSVSSPLHKKKQGAKPCKINASDPIPVSRRLRIIAPESHPPKTLTA
jgi:hypothetical protein